MSCVNELYEIELVTDSRGSWTPENTLTWTETTISLLIKFFHELVDVS